MARDLRIFLARLARELPDQLVTVSEPINTNLATSALLQNLENRGQLPVVVFTQPIAPSGKVSPFPLVVNTCATRAFLALALDLGADKYRDEPTLEATNPGTTRRMPLPSSPEGRWSSWSRIEKRTTFRWYRRDEAFWQAVFRGGPIPLGPPRGYAAGIAPRPASQPGFPARGSAGAVTGFCLTRASRDWR